MHNVIHALSTMMPGMNEVQQINYEDIAEGVRRFATERLYELERGLRPLVDGSFGEVLPGHLNAYLGLLRELGRIYQLSKPPRALQDLVPMDKVQELLAGMREQHARELAEAVALAETRARIEAASAAKLSIEAAKNTVSTRLMELEQRAGG